MVGSWCAWWGVIERGCERGNRRAEGRATGETGGAARERDDHPHSQPPAPPSLPRSLRPCLHPFCLSVPRAARTSSLVDCFQYRCARDVQTAVPGAAVAGVVQIRGPDGAWRSCDSPGQTFAVEGYGGVVTCPSDRSLCLRSCLAGTCPGDAPLAGSSSVAWSSSGTATRTASTAGPAGTGGPGSTAGPATTSAAGGAREASATRTATDSEASSAASESGASSAGSNVTRPAADTTGAASTTRMPTTSATGTTNPTGTGSTASPPVTPATAAAASFSLVLQVRAAYALADFDEPVRLRFRRSFAALACFCEGGCCLNESQVSLSVQEASVGGRRAGGGLLVNVTIAGAPSADAAASLASNLTADRINAALQAEGLGAVDVTVPAAVVRVAVSAAPTTTTAAPAAQTAPRTTVTPVVIQPAPSVANSWRRLGGLSLGTAVGWWMALVISAWESGC